MTAASHRQGPSVPHGRAARTQPPPWERLIFAEHLRGLADTIDRPSEVAALLEREGWRPELWDALERMEKRRAEMARVLRSRAAELESGARSRDEPLLAELNEIVEVVERCEREEERIFVRAFWQDLGGGG